ncbi:transposase [Lysinibacillus sp. KU-BSD001]|uniref:transposase n=1 Tax=Lysinibacillus sp. KU-BSD001 TaxID=3141328 RepID=UPI0036F0DFF0
MEKQTYYVSIVHLTCTTDPAGPYNFKIELEPYKARVFQKLFQQIHQLEGSNMFRAHLPFIPYHMDELNHDIDSRYKKIYALIHEFGDQEAKEFVEQIPYFS